MNNKVTRYDSDDFFSGSWLKNFFDLPIINSSNILKTNIRKESSNYIYEIDVPGYNKEDISINYEDGYLVIEAQSSSEYSNSQSSNKYVRQERYSGSCSRSFYIGEIDESKISAKYHNGILCVSFPDESNNQKSKIKKINIQ
jgi:HSP20 family molecular chaperone IbpA